MRSISITIMVKSGRAISANGPLSQQLVAATIAPILAAHGKTQPKNIEKAAVRAYHACLDEFERPRPTPEPDSE
jgi:hypothetical protein